VERLKDPSLRKAPALPALLLQRLARDKHSSSLQKFVYYGRKKFYRIGPRISYLIHRRNPWGNLSYADLITQAIKSSPDQRLTLAQVSMTLFLRHYSVALLGRLLTLLISIKLGLQGLLGTKTFAHCACL